MTITENFALAINLRHLYMTAPDGTNSINVTRQGQFFRADVSNRMVSADRQTTAVKPLAFECKEEQELWYKLLGSAPWLPHALAEAPHLFERGLALRCNMMLGLRDSELQAKRDEFARQTWLMWTTVLSALGAECVAKSTPALRVPSTAKNVALWQYMAKVKLPYAKEPELMHLQFFPSPVKDRTWLMRTYAPAPTEEILTANQDAIRGAEAKLESLGIHIEDVTRGSRLFL